MILTKKVGTVHRFQRIVIQTPIKSYKQLNNQLKQVISKKNYIEQKLIGLNKKKNFEESIETVAMYLNKILQKE